MCCEYHRKLALRFYIQFKLSVVFVWAVRHKLLQIFLESLTNDNSVKSREFEKLRSWKKPKQSRTETLVTPSTLVRGPGSSFSCVA